MFQLTHALGWVLPLPPFGQQDSVHWTSSFRLDRLPWLDQGKPIAKDFSSLAPVVGFRARLQPNPRKPV